MPGLLEPFPTQTWIAVRGWGRITGLGSCASDLGCGIGGGSGELVYIDLKLTSQINPN